MVRPPPAADAPPARLFCFPFSGSGSGASAFSAWPATAGDAEICPVQFPGRDNRLAHPHYASYENLAEQLVEALTPLLDIPFAFFGHCAGALPAYESALLLATAGLPTPQPHPAVDHGEKIRHMPALSPLFARVLKVQAERLRQHLRRPEEVERDQQTCLLRRLEAMSPAGRHHVLQARVMPPNTAPGESSESAGTTAPAHAPGHVPAS